VAHRFQCHGNDPSFQANEKNALPEERFVD
jgi:hypothetical protein